MKKKWRVVCCCVFLGCLTVVLAACFGKKKPKGVGEAIWREKWDTLISQDHPNNPMSSSWTDKGYYYYDERGLRYYDIATDSDIFLCSKPQCRHDGGAFCVATNNRYKLFQYCIYGGSLYALAVEEADGQSVCKLLAYALDGSDMKEVATLLTLPKSKKTYFDVKGYNNRLVLHRNKAFVSIGIARDNARVQEGEAEANKTEEEMQYSCGNMVVDLETREIVFLEDDPLDTHNLPVANVQAYGDFIYYTVEREGTKERPLWINLYEYNINKKTVQRLKLPEDFCGMYLVLDEDTIGFCRKTKSGLYVYSKETRENERKLEFYRTKRNVWLDESLHNYSHYYFAEDMRTDGHYIYVSERENVYAVSYGKKPEWQSEQFLNIYDMEFQLVASVDLKKVCDIIREKNEITEQLAYDFRRVAFCGEYIYFYPMKRTGANSVQILGSTLYRARLAELMANPQLISVETVGKAPVAVFWEIRN